MLAARNWKLSLSFTAGFMKQIVTVNFLFVRTRDAMLYLYHVAVRL